MTSKMENKFICQKHKNAKKADIFKLKRGQLIEIRFTDIYSKKYHKLKEIIRDNPVYFYNINSYNLLLTVTVIIKKDYTSTGKIYKEKISLDDIRLVLYYPDKEIKKLNRIIINQC